ncbi:MAG TPA: zinc ribbon domain-containing protein [Polyangiaceae bacterium]|jgi:putative FmdB family regulatory protein|nr:zinc ribbon domain-containing protein [Polyangiaceae bacterium]
MPIYEYEREDGTRFETRQNFADEALATDPDTGQKVHRVISAPRIIYKDTVAHFTSYLPSHKAKKTSK